jgi:hypothetical protein
MVKAPGACWQGTGARDSHSSTAPSLPLPREVVFILLCYQDFFKSDLCSSWQSWERAYTLENMSGLEEIATATTMASVIPFLSAWHAQGRAGQKYRQVVTRFAYFLQALLCIPFGIMLGGIALIAARFDPRPIESRQGLNFYCFRRLYRGEHHHGVSLERTLGALAG